MNRMETYISLLNSIKRKTSSILTLKDFFISSENSKEGSIIIRHDVDRRPENALKIAEIESKLDMILDEENSPANSEVAKLKKDVELGRIDPISASRTLVDLIKNLE